MYFNTYSSSMEMYGGIPLLPTFKINYVYMYMQHNYTYVYMWPIYVNMLHVTQHVNMQHYYVDMQHNMYYTCINIIILHVETNYGACQH